MTPGKLSKRVVTDRVAWVNRMIGEIQVLPLESQESFLSDWRNVSAAESCLRRALEALFDLGRHFLAKGFGRGITEYKDIASQLRNQGILSAEEAELLKSLAGYRNRMVHFYHEVEPEELYRICAGELTDLERIVGAYRRWVAAHPELLDEEL